MKRWILFLLVVLWSGVASADATLLDFSAAWCGPCKAMVPVVDQLDREGIAVTRIDIDRDRETAARFGVQVVPTFIIVERGKEVDRITGATTVEKLRAKLTRAPAIKSEAKDQSRPAWRYGRPEGHRAAIVRIYCSDSARVRSIGSGTLVNWRGRVLVLTARHVIQDAKKIIVWLHTRKEHAARVLKVDAKWDCAVLELEGKVEGVTPVELEYGEAAMQKEGNALESCGYGPDGKLACCTGRFSGYRRSTAAGTDTDDWMALSGYVRAGDSGGPIFNERGRLVGVVWGGERDGDRISNGIVAVQAGRIHLLLEAAFPKGYQQRAYDYTTGNVPLVPVQCGPNGCGPNGSDMRRNPTPAMPAPGVESFTADNSAPKDSGALLPWRGNAEKRDGDLEQRIAALLQAQEQERLARIAGQRPPPGISVDIGPKQEVKPTPTEAETSPLLAGLCVLGGVLVGFAIYFGGQKAA